jgi:DNA-binding Lrp family transcriptional regulator
LLEELTKLGVAAENVSLLDQAQLSELLSSLGKLLNNNKATFVEPKPLMLSMLDKEILYRLLTSDKEVSCTSLARELNVPLTTAQRRLKRLEGLFEHAYSIKAEMLGLRPFTFFVSIDKREASDVGKEILEMDRVISVSLVFNGKVDLKVEAYLRNDFEFVILEEKIKTVKGVKKTYWMESIKLLGRNNNTLRSIIG